MILFISIAIYACRQAKKPAAIATKMAFAAEDDYFCNKTPSNFTKSAGLVAGVPGVLCLTISVVGLVTELLFICKKKNNFLLRLFFYLSVDVTISHAITAMYLFIYHDPTNGVLCATIEAIIGYPTMVEFLFIISVNCVLLHKVYSSIRKPLFKFRGSKRAEMIFVAMHFAVPLVLIISLMAIAKEPRFWPSSEECYFPHSYIGADCQKRKTFQLLFKLIPEYIPVTVELILSWLCVSTLLVWLLWLLTKHYLRAKIGTVLKEIGLLLGYLISYCTIRILIEILNIADANKNDTLMLAILALYPINRATIPISFIIYVCCVFGCSGRRSERRANDWNTTGMQTARPSSRISLPSDTLAHSPKFLSEDSLLESYLTEQSHLLPTFSTIKGVN